MSLQQPQQSQQPQQWTSAQYLAFERSQPQKHEFIGGQIVLQAGSSRNHAIISSNIIGNLYTQLSKGSCIIFGSDMRVAIPQAHRYVYPDVSIACGELQFEDSQSDTLLNPRVLFEILSPSTERYDRSTKFQAYQKIESFQEYVLIAQDIPLVEHFVRHSDKLWTFESLTELKSLLTLASIDCRLTLEDIYAHLNLHDHSPDMLAADE